MAVDAQYHHLFSPQLYTNRESMNPACTGSAVAAAPWAPVFNTVVPATAESPTRKRSIGSLSFLGEDVSSQVYSHMADVDRLIVQHLVNARTELSQKRRRFSSQIVAALNESVSKRLKAKDEEIEQLRKLSWAMEERIKSLGMESNAWRYLAQTHEAAAAAIRAELDRVLADQAAAVAAEADDAESCCGDNDFVGTKEWKRMCRSCGGGEPSVLLLPCRHLCVCAACSPAIDRCPICKCSKNGSVNVNLC